MSTFYLLDSIFRDRITYPNPADFTVPASITNAWKTNTRTVQAVKSYCEKPVLNFVFNVTLLNLTLPVDFTTTAYGSNPPFLFVEFRNTSGYTDKNLININTTESLKDAVFVVYQDKTIGDQWVYFACKNSMTQTYRIDPKGEMKFRVFDDFGETVQITDTIPPVPPDPLAQVSALFQMSPYVRDDTRESHYPQIYTCV